MKGSGVITRSLFGALVLVTTAHAADVPTDRALKADGMFSDNMVLQRGMCVPVWGTAAPEETVTVSIRDQRKQTRADTNGNWMVKLDPLKTGDATTLTISSSADTAIAFTNVLVGEIWIATGQSNMAGGTGGYRKNDRVLDEWADAAVNMPLRLYDRHKRTWRMPSEQTINSHSALAFAFMYSLCKQLDVPVGTMVVAHDGQPSGKWLTAGMAAASGCELLEKYAAGEVDLSLDNVKPGSKHTYLTPETMGEFYRNEISMFRPYAIRGVLWDQGEGGTCLKGVDQFTAMSALIAGWRKDWGQPPSPGSGVPWGDFPFLHMQKPSGDGCAWDPANPVNRGAKPFGKQPSSPSRVDPKRVFYALDHIGVGTLPNAPLVTTLDLAPGVHPPTKSAYGARACRVALGAVYGRDVVVCGPVYRSHKLEGDAVRVTFNHVGKGLAFRHGERLQGFELAGSDGKWNWAEATIDRAARKGQPADTVLLRCAAVPRPVYVRYAFDPEPSFANLFNNDGLPALPFTTMPLPVDTRPSFGRHR